MAPQGPSSPHSGSPRRQDGGKKSGEPRTTITRVRTGCFTCRKRKKKCDEHKPACGNCQKTGVVCEGFPQPQIWEDRIAAKRHHAGNTTATSPSPEFGLHEVATTSKQPPPFGLVDGPAFLDTAQPNYDFMTEPQFGDGLDFMFEQQASPVALNSMMGSPNVEINISSDQGFNGMIMAPGEMSHSRELERRQYLGAQQSFIPTELPFLISGIDTDIHRRLFCHFTGVMSSLLAITVKDSNPFNSVVIPLALRDRTVMDTILSLAGSHLLKLRPVDWNDELSNERSRLHDAAVRKQTDRVQTLKQLRLSSAPTCTFNDKEAIFATSLLLCLYEICEGTGNDAWRGHLDMARQVITGPESPPTSGESHPATELKEHVITGINPFLLEFFLYHDSLATVTVPSLPTTRTRFRSTADILPQDSYMVGVQDGLSDFVTRISTLRVQADASHNQPDGDVVCKAVQIWQDLARWKPRAAISSERHLIAKFYQWALFIWLFSIVYPEGKADNKVQSAVRRLADGMCNIKSGEGVMSCLLFPLFIIGSAAIRVQDREAISAQFSRLRAWSSFGNIDLTYDIVKKMWEDHDLGLPKSWDWVKQLEVRGMSFLVT